MGKRRRKNANKTVPVPFGFYNPQNVVIQQPIPKPPSSGRLYDMMERNKLLQNHKKEKELLELQYQGEIGKLKSQCQDYEEQLKHLKGKLVTASTEKRDLLDKNSRYELQATELKDKLAVLATEKHALLDKNQRYEKQATDLKEDIKLLKKSAWIGIDNYAKIKIESLEKQVEEDVIKIQELKDNARVDKVTKLKMILEDKEKIIRKFDDTIKDQNYRIDKMTNKIKQQSDKVILMGKDLHTKDKIITKLRTEKKDDSDGIQLTEVIKEKEFIEIHTIVDEDVDRDSSRNKYCQRCKCLVNPEGIFESDLAKRMKMEDIKNPVGIFESDLAKRIKIEDIKSEIKTEKC